MSLSVLRFFQSIIVHSKQPLDGGGSAAVDSLRKMILTTGDTHAHHTTHHLGKYQLAG